MLFSILETVWSLISTVVAVLMNKDEMSVCSFNLRIQRSPRVLSIQLEATLSENMFSRCS